MTITSQANNRRRARITSQGQITVPKAIRIRLGVKPGDDLEFVERGTEIVIVPRPRRSILDFAGVLAPPPGTVLPRTDEEWKQATRDAWADAAIEKENRILRQSSGNRRA